MPREDNPDTVGSDVDCHPISLRSFANLFRDHVRVDLNFPRLLDAHCRVGARVVHDPTALKGWLSPWYVDADGYECGYADVGATPIPFVGLDGYPIPPPPSHSEKVALIATAMRKTRSAPMLIAGYKPAERELVIVLDGNHRLRAALANGDAIHVMALLLHGPNDPTILADLATSAPSSPR